MQDLEEQDTTSVGHLSIIRQVGRARYREWIQQRLIYENIWNQILVALPSIDRRIIVVQRGNPPFGGGRKRVRSVKQTTDYNRADSPTFLNYQAYI